MRLSQTHRNKVCQIHSICREAYNSNQLIDQFYICGLLFLKRCYAYFKSPQVVRIIIWENNDFLTIQKLKMLTSWIEKE
ncbi:hypothetical protein FGO68_gene17024 [Halteria grandinella]|uniref:Uncharacterized protein n=1 Tax=Halteria grandinella TaxID=5974 RepID=A0A8J8NC94_HALGN|nr:hypothetical protein FGO68_gene17024 [Halteria grandinella]